MKKTTLFMACCIGLMFFASCKKDPTVPTINILEDVGCVTENALVYSGDEILVGFTGTGENLTQIEIVISQNGIVLANHSDNLNSQTDLVSPYNYKHAFTIEAIGTVNIKGTVIDAKGQTASKSFNVNYNEKPNAKFVGHYEGDALVNGTYDINISNMVPIHEDLTDRPFPSIVEMETGENIDEVIATVTINGESNTTKGTVDGSKVVFEAINSSYSMTYEYNGFPITIPLDMTYNIIGTLNEGKLNLEGECMGSGNISIPLFNISGTIEMEGTVSGSLNKTE